MFNGPETSDSETHETLKRQQKPNGDTLTQIHHKIITYTQRAEVNLNLNSVKVDGKKQIVTDFLKSFMMCTYVEGQD